MYFLVFKNLDIGKLKSQTTDIDTPPSLNYTFKDLDNLNHINVFVNISEEDLELSMDCYLDNYTETCLYIGVKKCRTLHHDDPIKY